jgi:FlaA1/EpsC-like NDP-sugar epimerase
MLAMAVSPNAISEICAPMLRNRFVKFAQIAVHNRTWLTTTVQAGLVVLALLVAWMLRFDFSLPQKKTLYIVAPILVVVRIVAIWRFGLLRGWWRYVGIDDMFQIIKAVAVGSVFFLVLVRYGLGLTSFPRTVYFMEALLTASFLGGARVLSRLLAESFRQARLEARKIAVIGAGVAARMVVRELQQPGSGYEVVAFFDDDHSKIGMRIMGIKVAGTVDDLPAWVESQTAVDEILIAVPSATSAQMNRFAEIADQAGTRYRTVPPLRELILGNMLIDQIREVHLEDLLGRDAVELDLETVRAQISGRVVMVTGAAGSIGSELCRQILEFAPATLVCLDKDETGVFHLQTELVPLAGDCDLVMCVADVRDRERLRKVCFANEVHVIFHAAAYKHVPMMESNVEEAVQNNVGGLLALLDVAEQAHCRDLVMISTDKAVNPTSVMGATKRIGELVLSSRPPNGLRCTSVRFGNVLGSNGSVIPTFQDQLRKGLPLTVTHPDIQRFFMTIPEAVSLVLQAFVVGKHGDVLVLDMGQQVKIIDLARRLIHLAGKREEDVPILFTGLRPGEKLVEELFYPAEEVLPTSHAKIKHTRFRGPSWTHLMAQLSQLNQACMSGDEADVKAMIKCIVPEYEATAETEAEPVHLAKAANGHNAMMPAIHSKEGLADARHG